MDCRSFAHGSFGLRDPDIAIRQFSATGSTYFSIAFDVNGRIACIAFFQLYTKLIPDCQFYMLTGLVTKNLILAADFASQAQ